MVLKELLCLEIVQLQPDAAGVFTLQVIDVLVRAPVLW
jgi:hypothetical protein